MDYFLSNLFLFSKPVLRRLATTTPKKPHSHAEATEPCYMLIIVKFIKIGSEEQNIILTQFTQFEFGLG